jgi:hypothetical protein
MVVLDRPVRAGGELLVGPAQPPAELGVEGWVPALCTPVVAGHCQGDGHIVVPAGVVLEPKSVLRRLPDTNVGKFLYQAVGSDQKPPE